MTGIRLALALALATPMPAAFAADFALGEGIAGRFNATVTVGTLLRTESADPAVYGSLSGPAVGLPAGRLGANAGTSDLNFRKGRPVSTVFKGVADLELKGNGVGVFARVMAWNDSELKGGTRAYGNTPNGFSRNAPLSDARFAAAAKFSNAQVADAYVFAGEEFGAGTRLEVKLGRQALSWGVAQFSGGGINVINPANLAAQQRPGALPEESRLPVGMLYANLAEGQKWGIEGYLQYEFRATAIPGCGTFFVTTNYLPAGCNYVSVLPIPDQAALSQGLYPKRLADLEAEDSGQYGLSLRYVPGATKTELRAYAMNYHSRTPSIRGINPAVAGGYGSLATLTRLTDAHGLKYGLIYPENIKLYGLSFATRLDASAQLYGEIAYRPNQPLNLNTSDLIAAFLTRSPAAALQLAKNTNAIAPGDSFSAYDRFRVMNASLGASKLFAGTWGAAQLTLSGEIGVSHVAALPGPGMLRYGRSDIYGVAAVNGLPCTDTTAAQKSCAHDGFITSDAWGYRLRLAASYPDALLGAALTPSLSFAHDASGYSYDGSFLRDRKTIRSGIRAQWGRKYFSEIQYTMVSGGSYNPQVDRDTLSLVVGASF